MYTRGKAKRGAKRPTFGDPNRPLNTSLPNLTSETRPLLQSAPASRHGSPSRLANDLEITATVRPADRSRQPSLATDLVNQSPLNIGNLKSLLDDLKTSITNELSAQIDRKLEARLPSTASTVGTQPQTVEAQPSLSVSNTNSNVDSRAPKTTAILCDKFFGSNNSIPAKEWVDVFQAVTLDWSDRDRVRALPRHLSDEALCWFSLEIVPCIQNITWTESRQKLIARFGQVVTNPIVEATNRRLSPKESVSNYFNDKRRLLIQAGASEQIQVALLTSGMPESYQAFIASQCPLTTSDWLRIALLVEQTRTRRFTRPGESTFHGEEVEKFDKRRPSYKSNRFYSKNTQSERPPPTPCPICIKLGLKEDTMHWKRLCPHREQEISTQNSRQGSSSHVINQPLDCNPIFAVDYVYLNVKVNGHRFRPFLDTGSKITGMSELAAKKAGLEVDPRTSIEIRQIDGMTRTIGRVNIRLQIGESLLSIFTSFLTCLTICYLESMPPSHSVLNWISPSEEYQILNFHNQ